MVDHVYVVEEKYEAWDTTEEWRLVKDLGAFLDPEEAREWVEVRVGEEQNMEYNDYKARVADFVAIRDEAERVRDLVRLAGFDPDKFVAQRYANRSELLTFEKYFATDGSAQLSNYRVTELEYRG